MDRVDLAVIPASQESVHRDLVDTQDLQVSPAIHLLLQVLLASLDILVLVVLVHQASLVSVQVLDPRAYPALVENLDSVDILASQELVLPASQAILASPAIHLLLQDLQVSLVTPASQELEHQVSQALALHLDSRAIPV